MSVVPHIPRILYLFLECYKELYTPLSPPSVRAPDFCWGIICKWFILSTSLSANCIFVPKVLKMIYFNCVNLKQMGCPTFHPHFFNRRSSLELISSFMFSSKWPCLLENVTPASVEDNFSHTPHCWLAHCAFFNKFLNSWRRQSFCTY